MTECVPLTNVTLFFCTLQCTCMSYFYPENWVSGRENHQSILRRTLCNWNLCCVSWTCMLETFKSEIMIPFEFSSNTSHIFCALNWRARDTFRNIKKVTFEGYSLVLLSRAEGRSIDCQTGRMETKTQRDWCVYYRLLSISKCQILVCQELLGKKKIDGYPSTILAGGALWASPQPKQAPSAAVPSWKWHWWTCYSTMSTPSLWAQSSSLVIFQHLLLG